MAHFLQIKTRPQTEFLDTLSPISPLVLPRTLKLDAGQTHDSCLAVHLRRVIETNNKIFREFLDFPERPFAEGYPFACSHSQCSHQGCCRACSTHSS